jgi:hypothetical protein
MPSLYIRKTKPLTAGERIKHQKASRGKYRRSEKYLTTDRRAHLKHKYGMSPEQYDKMLTAQHGVCAVCKQPETAQRAGRIKLLSVDHSHTTKQTRGLLCDNCNRALGSMHDNIERLQSAIEYLNRYSKGHDEHE